MSSTPTEQDTSFVIPTICLDEPIEAIIPSLRSACLDVGFFYLEGHGISTEELDEVFQESKELFALSLSEKQALSDKVMSRGYTAMQEETLDPSIQTEGDTKEGFYIGTDIPRADDRYEPAKFRGPNQWPDKKVLPTFQSTMQKYHSTLTSISLQVVQYLALVLGLEKTHFDGAFEEAMATIRLLHYDQRQSEPEEGVFACGAHSDYGMLTLLLTDENSGLQICHQSKWIDVPPRPNAFVVNLGDMLERWTNGLMKSTRHRVLTRGDQERYSIPFFFDPCFDTVVECLEVCIDGSNPPQYPPTTAGEHLVSKYLQTHADFSPEAVAIQT